MSYSNINEVFNTNNKIEQTIQGLNTNFNPTDSTYASLKFANGTLTNIPNQYEPGYESPFDNICDNNSNLSLNGTDLTNLVTKKEEKKTIKKLTHRDCVNIYFNPSNYDDTSMNNAFKHITKCSLCKEEIKKNKNKRKDISSEVQHSNNVITTNNTANNSNSNTNSNTNNSNVNNIENQLKILQDKMNEDSNLKYQNTMLQNTITKYMEDIEEKKNFNSKIDKILELLNENLKLNTNLNNQLSQQLNQLNQLSQLNQLNNVNHMNQMNHLNQQPNHMNMMNQMGNNIRHEMFTQVGSQPANSGPNIWLIIGIVVIILLLIIDIYMRINSTKKDN